MGLAELLRDFVHRRVEVKYCVYTGGRPKRVKLEGVSSTDRIIIDNTESFDINLYITEDWASGHYRQELPVRASSSTPCPLQGMPGYSMIFISPTGPASFKVTWKKRDLAKPAKNIASEAVSLIPKP